MKFVLIVHILISLSYASNLRNLSTPGDDCVIFYQHRNYEGDKVEKCNSIEEVGSNWKNRYSSVKLGANVEYLKVYSGKQFQGTLEKYTTDMADLGDLNDDIQSFSISTYIPDNCIRLWEREHLKGASLTICESKPTINSIRQDRMQKFFEKRKNYTAYVQYGNGVDYAFFYSDENYENKSNTQGDYTGKNSSIDSGFRSINIMHETLPDNCIWIFSEQYYNGLFIELCDDNKNISGYQIRSFQLGDGITSITGYDSINYNGESKTYTSNKSTLGTWKDRIQSFKI